MIPKGFCDMPFLAGYSGEREKLHLCLLRVVLLFGLITNYSPKVSTFILNDNSPPFYISYSVICIFKLSFYLSYKHFQVSPFKTNKATYTQLSLDSVTSSSNQLLSLVFLSHPSFLKQNFTIPKKTNTSLPFFGYSVSLA